MSGNVARPSPDILTYRHGSRMVYVTPGETFEQALDFAQEVFPELRNIERERISLQVHSPPVRGQSPRSTVQIGRMAWLPVISTLSRFEVVEVCVAPPPLPAVIYSGSAAALPPYALALEASGHQRKWGSK